MQTQPTKQRPPEYVAMRQGNCPKEHFDVTTEPTLWQMVRAEARSPYAWATAMLIIVVAWVIIVGFDMMGDF